MGPQRESSSSKDSVSSNLKDRQDDFDPFEVEVEQGQTRMHIDNLDESLRGGPVDLDEILQNYAIDGVRDDDTLFNDEVFNNLSENSDPATMEDAPQFFNNPNQRLLDTDASFIPGSPFSKPAIRPSNRPSEPLRIARYASSLAFLFTTATVVLLFFTDTYAYSNNVGRLIIELILSLLSFFGLFWNIYYTVSGILKCFIPSKAFKTNTKYCSIIPEKKDPSDEWLEVTIQIPVYKESMVEVLMPTLKSCIAARDHYRKRTETWCNIVICDDGMMAMLHDNFPAAEMLWRYIHETRGRVMQLSKLLEFVPRASKLHLKGLQSKDVYEVFHRMLYYYHYDIGFVARSTVNRRGKFKKASNLNAHLRLALGAQQRIEQDVELTLEDAMLEEVHNEVGSRFVMFGNDIRIGHLICVNDADSRMAEPIIAKTVPEFLNDKSLGFTQHATKTMTEQRGESYFTNLLAVYTDSLYQGHFLLSSILGCHPPLLGHSIFLRTEVIKQCGRVRTLREAQKWLESIGLHFLPVDQVGFGNLQAENRIEYWSESHVSEDFELMIHLYSLGFNGRYVNYEGCEFQEGITRTFDEEAGRHRKFSLGAHELVFNPFQDMLSHGIFTPVFRTFMKCDIPSYYKIYLSAYLCSYASGGTYIIVFTVSAILRILDREGHVDFISAFNPASIIILNFIVYYVLGYITFLIAMIRMSNINNELLFPEYRKKWCSACYLVFVQLRYCFTFQFLFYNVAIFTIYFLGSMDHMLSRTSVLGATNKDSINISRCKAFCNMVSCNIGSWLVALTMAGLAYVTVLSGNNWSVSQYPSSTSAFLHQGLFAGPAFVLALLAFIVPILLNPWILGWPFYRNKKKNKKMKKPKQKLTNPTKRSEPVDIPEMASMPHVKASTINSKGEFDADSGMHSSYRIGPDKSMNASFCDAREVAYEENTSQQSLPNMQDFGQQKRKSALEPSLRIRELSFDGSRRSWDGNNRRSLSTRLAPKSFTSGGERQMTLSPTRRLERAGYSERQRNSPASTRSPTISRSPSTTKPLSWSPSLQDSSSSPGREKLQKKQLALPIF